MPVSQNRALFPAMAAIAFAFTHAALAPAAETSPADPRPPRVVVILADDAGYGDYSSL